MSPSDPPPAPDRPPPPRRRSAPPAEGEPRGLLGLAGLGLAAIGLGILGALAGILGVIFVADALGGSSVREFGKWGVVAGLCAGVLGGILAARKSVVRFFGVTLMATSLVVALLMGACASW